ncbi:uncharacterized protein LOC121735704 [Aricia agestis]|uniref:uncharacterized protein LOC121735704 n=1 Tax=Aricia agestis TaxID=91739 RepID=UPI001C203FA9|nr:uncharacterized protein LOC121735704 [Aricia agestis]
MVEEYSIDNELLISLVEQKPVLWDKTMELYKNRVATQAAWKEILVMIVPNLETKEEKTRQALAKLIMQKWTHIRDSYHRSYKKIQDQKRSGSGGKTAKPYVYSKQLSFLQKVIQPKEIICDVTAEYDTESDNSTEYENQKNDAEVNETFETYSIETHDNMTLTTESPIPKRIAKRSLENAISPVDAKIIKFMDSYSNEPKTMNRHLSFFNGILPSLDKFDDDEVLEFQMGVLQLIKKIKNNRQNSRLVH